MARKSYEDGVRAGMCKAAEMLDAAATVHMQLAARVDVDKGSPLFDIRRRARAVMVEKTELLHALSMVIKEAAV